jgi:hypothetical protein
VLDEREAAFRHARRRDVDEQLRQGCEIGHRHTLPSPGAAWVT